jgi:hypothetical protein
MRGQGTRRGGGILARAGQRAVQLAPADRPELAERDIADEVVSRAGVVSGQSQQLGADPGQGGPLDPRLGGL